MVSVQNRPNTKVPLTRTLVSGNLDLGRGPTPITDQSSSLCLVYASMWLMRDTCFPSVWDLGRCQVDCLCDQLPVESFTDWHHFTFHMYPMSYKLIFPFPLNVLPYQFQYQYFSWLPFTHLEWILLLFKFLGAQPRLRVKGSHKFI